jgi:hypothetical protein
MFQHGQAHLSMWHVWWHIGLRKYASTRRQRQQQQPQQLGGVNGHAGGSVSSLLSGSLSAAELDALYLDPDAK